MTAKTKQTPNARLNHVKRLGGTLMSKPEMGTVIPLVILLLIIAMVNKNFYSKSNLLDVMRTTSFTFILAVPLTCLMLTGNRDLSVGATTALGGIVCAWGLTDMGLGVVPSVLMALAAGAVVGVVKAGICLKLKLPPFIITLGLQYMINGFILVTTQGNPITGFPKIFTTIGQGKLSWGLHYTVVIGLVLGVLVHVMLTRTKIGREIYAVGGNRETARLAGINVNKTLLLAHVATSVAAAFVGVLYASRFNSAQYNAGAGSEMTILCAIVIGGTSFSGGVGSIVGSFLGCLLLACISNGLVLMHVSTYYQNLVMGGILILSLVLDRIRSEKSGGGL